MDGAEVTGRTLVKEIIGARGIGDKAGLITRYSKTESGFKNIIAAFTMFIKLKGVNDDFAGIANAGQILASSEIPMELKVRIIEAISENEPVIAGWIILDSWGWHRALFPDIVFNLAPETRLRIFNTPELYNNIFDKKDVAEIVLNMSNAHPEEAQALAEGLKYVKVSEFVTIEKDTVKWLKEATGAQVARQLSKYEDEGKAADVLKFLYEEDNKKFVASVESGLAYSIIEKAGFKNWAIEYCGSVFKENKYKVLENLDFKLVASAIEAKAVSPEIAVDAFNRVKKLTNLAKIIVFSQITPEIKADMLRELLRNYREAAVLTFMEVIRFSDAIVSGEGRLGATQKVFVTDIAGVISHLGVQDSAELLNLYVSRELVSSQSFFWLDIQKISELVFAFYKEDPARARQLAELLEEIPMPGITPIEKCASILDRYVETSESFSRYATKVIDYSLAPFDVKIDILNHMKLDNRDRIIKSSDDLKIIVNFNPEKLFSGGKGDLWRSMLSDLKKLSDSELMKIVKEFEGLPYSDALVFINRYAPPQMASWLLKKASPEFSNQLMKDSSLLQSITKQKDILRPDFDIDIIIDEGQGLGSAELKNLKSVLRNVPLKRLGQVKTITIIGNEYYKRIAGENNFLESQFHGMLGYFLPGFKNITLSEGQLSDNSLEKTIRIKGANFIKELVIHESWHAARETLSEKEWAEFIDIAGWKTAGYYVRSHYDDTPNKTLSEYNTNPDEAFAEAGTHLELGKNDVTIDGKLNKGLWTRAREALMEGDPVIALEALFVRWVPDFSRGQFGVKPQEGELIIEETGKIAVGLFKDGVISKDKLEFIERKLEFIKGYMTSPIDGPASISDVFKATRKNLENI